MTSPGDVFSLVHLGPRLAALRSLADRGVISESLYLELARSLASRPVSDALAARVERGLRRHVEAPLSRLGAR